MCDDSFERPCTPKQEDCCGNDCNPCIFDVHNKLLEQWKKDKTLRISGRENILAPTLYKLFRVVELVRVNEDYVTISMSYQDENSDKRRIIIEPGHHVMVSYSSYSKPFTPFSWNENSLQILVRIYENGTFTKKLKDIEIGEEIKLRGPYGNFQYSRNTFLRILMFGIGSGLAALYPVAKSIIDDELDESKIQLIAGFSTVEQVPLKKELRLLCDFWNFKCTLHISKFENESGKSINGINLKSGRIDCNVIECDLRDNLPEKTLILICGNEEFNKSLEIWIKQCDFKNYYIFQ